MRLLPLLDLEDELRARLEVLRLRLPLAELLLWLDELPDELLLDGLRLAELRVAPELRLRLPLEDEREDLDEPEDDRLRPLELLAEPDRLFVPDERDRELLDEREDLEPERERDDWPERPRLLLLPVPPLRCSCPLSSSLLSSFLATAAAAGTATPSAAPAATFFPVDIPSFPSTSFIWTSSIGGASAFALRLVERLDELRHDPLANDVGAVVGDPLAGGSGRILGGGMSASRASQPPLPGRREPLPFESSFVIVSLSSSVASAIGSGLLMGESCRPEICRATLLLNAKRFSRPPARTAGGRRCLSQHCQDRDDQRDDEDQPQEVADRNTTDDREDHQQDDQ